MTRAVRIAELGKFKGLMDLIGSMDLTTDALANDPKRGVELLTKLGSSVAQCNEALIEVLSEIGAL